MRIVLDTNVLVAALIRNGKSRSLLLEIMRSGHELVFSREILEEFAQVAGEPKIRRYVDEEDMGRFLRDVASISRIVGVRSRFRFVGEDPSDDVILRTCYDGKAKYIVSGDKHLLRLKRFRRIRIVTVENMLRILRAK